MTFIKINKKEKSLQLISDKRVVFNFTCLLGKNIGRKLQKNDMKTPDGKYKIIVKNPKSKYFLSLGIDYPNIKDAKDGLANGFISQQTKNEIIQAHKKHKKIPWQTDLGGEIYIHGQGDDDKNWTRGCIKLKNKDMKELFKFVKINDEVIIV